jgi:hypothetical protein
MANVNHEKRHRFAISKHHGRAWTTELGRSSGQRASGTIDRVLTRCRRCHGVGKCPSGSSGEASGRNRSCWLAKRGILPTRRLKWG